MQFVMKLLDNTLQTNVVMLTEIRNHNIVRWLCKAGQLVKKLTKSSLSTAQQIILHLF